MIYVWFKTQNSLPLKNKNEGALIKWPGEILQYVEQEQQYIIL